MAEQRPSLAGSGRCRQGRAPPRNSRQDNVRNRLLSAQRAFDARTLQRSRSLALGRRKSAALSARWSHRRCAGSLSFGNRPHNLAVLRHMALSVMQKERENGALRGKFKRAAWDEPALARLLTQF